MPSYISRDFACAACQEAFTDLVLRADDAAGVPTPCIKCGAPCQPAITAPALMLHARPDGSGTLDPLRRTMQLKKERAEARKNGDRESEKKINKEMKKL